MSTMTNSTTRSQPRSTMDDVKSDAVAVRKDLATLRDDAVDVGSRPYGKSCFDKKPAGVLSNSPGAIGGFGANHHLRQCLVFLNMPTLQQPEAYVGGIADAFAEDGTLVKDSLREFLQKYIDAFAGFVAQQHK